MKTKFAQLVSFVNKFDRRHLQLVYFIFAVVGLAVINSPSDGSIGPI